MWKSETDSLHPKLHILTWVMDSEQDVLFDHAMTDLDALVATDSGARWVLDVAAITMLSSNAIAHLIGVVRRINLANGRMVLARPAPAVASVLRMTRLTKMLPMYEDLAQAKAAVLS